MTTGGADVVVTDNLRAQRYEAHVGPIRAGFVTYRRAPGVVTFVHTEVDPAFEGHGVGSRLASAVLDDARARGQRVVPRCRFIAAWIEGHPEYGDLVATQ